MSVIVFSNAYLDNLVAEAISTSRLRQHRNIHLDYADPCQRLFNAIQPESYIRPHRHGVVPRPETMIAIRGLMALLVFDDGGNVVDTVKFGEQQIIDGSDVAVGVETPAGCWHTVVALHPGSVLLEVKGGPFDPAHPKELAPWAPEEGSEESRQYLRDLIAVVQGVSKRDRVYVAQM